MHHLLCGRKNIGLWNWKQTVLTCYQSFAFRRPSSQRKINTVNTADILLDWWFQYPCQQRTSNPNVYQLQTVPSLFSLLLSLSISVNLLFFLSSCLYHGHPFSCSVSLSPSMSFHWISLSLPLLPGSKALDLCELNSCWFHFNMWRQFNFGGQPLKYWTSLWLIKNIVAYFGTILTFLTIIRK